MPKGILEFNLPDDQEEFKQASNAMSLWCDVYSFKEFLHFHADEVDMPEEKRAVYYAIWDRFCEEVGHHFE